jgi:imidazolonepropionase-like amidohydrolase
VSSRNRSAQLLAVALGTVVVGWVLACRPISPTTAYIGAAVWDGTENSPLRDATIIVKGGRVEDIGRAGAVRIPRGAEEIQLAGKWVIPGLIDAHVHAERWTFRRLLAYGITSIRDVGGVLDSVLAMREDVNLGSVLGPRMFAAGAMIDGAPATWPGAIEVTTLDQARRAVGRLRRLNASQVKVYTRIDETFLSAIVDEARELELPVSAHLGKVDAISAAELGLAAIEHLSGIVEASVERPERYYRDHDDFFTGWNRVEGDWVTVDSGTVERIAAELIRQDVTIVPTLTLHEAYSRLTDQAYYGQLDLSGVPDDVQLAWDIPDLVRRARLTITEFRALRRARPYQDRFVRFYARRGGKVAAGSDTPNQLLAPGASLHDELSMLVRAGLSPRDALLAATREPARLVGADTVGVLRPGAVADFLVLDGNPLADVANARRIDFIVFRGTAHRPADILARTDQ